MVLEPVPYWPYARGGVANNKLTGGGQPLRGGWKMAACQCRGDWEFFSDIFHLPRWNGAEQMCPFCRASSTIPHLSFTNVRLDAPWRGTQWTHETRMTYLRVAGLALPILFVALIGFRLECIHIDVLHTTDQGVSSHIAGNVMWHIAVVKRCLGGTTQAQNIQKLQECLVKWYKSTKCQRRLQGALSIERIRSQSDWPKLKGKAAATRAVIAFCVFLMETYGDGSVTDNRILSLCKLMQRFYTIISSEGQFLSASAKLEIPKLSQTLAAIYVLLANDAFREGIKMWKTQPKLHLFQHLCEYMCLYQGNPKYFWTYQDEDLVGEMIELCQSVHATTMAVSAIFKWAHFMFGNTASK